MNFREQAKFQSLANRIGDISHVSSWLKGISALAGVEGQELQEWLLKCAVERGADHYARPFSRSLPPDSDKLSHEDLAIALCHPSLPYSPICIRAAAQLLSSPGVDLERLAYLAKTERVEIMLKYVACMAEKVAPLEEPWRSLRARLAPRMNVNIDGLPHWSRFVEQTGITAPGENGKVIWLRRGQGKHE